jgi:hypothetical protein
VRITSVGEQEKQTFALMQKLMAIKNMYPNNMALQGIIQKRILNVVELTPEEIDDIKAEEEEKQKLTKEQILQQTQMKEQPTPEISQAPPIEAEQTPPMGELPPEEEGINLEEMPTEKLLQLRQAITE